ncbi:MAG TPA: FAD-dependent oxidoreductase [Pseudonocardiaceae bacterium]|nr:FAD-dependent oxidoreductase [Pseudonocardiaceae bacterium]
MDAQRTTCVVAGGGPAGMVLGLLLARARVEVTVLEKHADFLRDFRGDTVHPSTLRLLDELGLAEKFEKLPYSKVERAELPGPDGVPVTTADFTRLSGKYRYLAMVPQWDLLDLLAEAGAAEPTFTLRMDTAATGTLTERGRVVGVSYRTAAGDTGELRAELTIAADGRWSLLRTAVGLRATEYPVPMDTWWTRLPRHADDAPTGLRVNTHGTDMGLTLNRDDYYQVAYFARKGFDPTLRAEGMARFRERLTALFPVLADRMDAVQTMDQVKFLDVRLNRLRRWHTDGLLCIGDAAHAMSPIGGVGINLAVQDAVATATLLAGPLLRGRVRPAELAKVRRRRWLPTVLVQTAQRAMHRFIIAPVVTGRRTTTTEVPARLLQRLPVMHGLLAYLVGIGPRPEHAPEFARRAPVRG